MAKNPFFGDLADAIAGDWRATARPDQLPPPGDWTTWLILAGRGFGKTRTGAEWIRDNVCGSTPLARGRYGRIALVAETAADARDTMVGDGKPPGEGSGILQCHPKDFRPLYESSKRRLTWPNGAIATLYNGTEPGQLRGPEHDAAWVDELAKFQYAQETWDQLQFGLRRGKLPRVCVTTTPRAIKILRTIMNDSSTVITRGKTLDNAKNLPKTYLEKLLKQYGGTRLGSQELDAEMLSDTPGALWKLGDIERSRITSEYLPSLQRIVVAIDPAVSNHEGSDETGIIVAGVGQDGRGYVLEDLSGRFSPLEWADIAVKAYRRWRADRIVAEVNQGGLMVETTIRTVDRNVSFKSVHATRGKATRAEPIAALYEQGRVHHVGCFPTLEDQMIAFTSDFNRGSAGYSPDRVDSLAWALTDLCLQDTPGWGILEFYRLQALEIGGGTVAGAHGGAGAPNLDVRLIAPEGISAVYMMSGRQTFVDDARSVLASPEDAAPLLAAGWRVYEEAPQDV
jgi:phage terminase large subunit-like protein